MQHALFELEVMRRMRSGFVRIAPIRMMDDILEKVNRLHIVVLGDPLIWTMESLRVAGFEYGGGKAVHIV